MRNVLVYSHESEPITKALLRPSLFPELNIIPVSVSQILNDTEIFDQIIDGNPSISWKLSSGQLIENDHNTLLINRVMELSPDLFLDFHSDDQEYALLEFNAYLAFALYAFPHKTASPGQFGLAGDQFSLPQQWKKAKEAGLTTPSFYLGARAHCPYTEEKQNIVYSSIYNYYNWKPSEQPKKDYLFCFERPKGSPYLIFTIANQTTVKPLSAPHFNTDINISSENMQEYAQKISSIFNHSICETLVFIDNKDITFCMTSNFPKYFSQNKSHPEMLARYINEAPWFS